MSPLLTPPEIVGKTAIRPSDPNGTAVADSLDEGKAAFRAAGEAHWVRPAFVGNYGQEMPDPSNSVDDPYRLLVAVRTV